MKILFYQDPPKLQSTMLTWSLGEELILQGHEVVFGKPALKQGIFDVVRGGGETSWDAVKYARSIGARVHIHLEGIGYWRVGADSARNWGLDVDRIPDSEINHWMNTYSSWMSAAYAADSCSVNGARQIQVIQDILFNGKPLPNCHRLSCGADARYALSLPDVKKSDYIVTCSRIAPNKKIMHIARALASIAPNQRLPWVVIGYGNQDYVKQVVSFCEEHGIVLHIAPCFGAAKWMLIKRAKLMVQGWNGIPPAEGLLCDTPVVAFDHPDVMEMYSHTDSNDVEWDALHWATDNSSAAMADVILETLSRMKLFGDRITPMAVSGKGHLMKGLLYACTLEQSAAQYEKIFMEG